MRTVWRRRAQSAAARSARTGPAWSGRRFCVRSDSRPQCIEHSLQGKGRSAAAGSLPPCRFRSPLPTLSKESATASMTDSRAESTFEPSRSASSGSANTRSRIRDGRSESDILLESAVSDYEVFNGAFKYFGSAQPRKQRKADGGSQAVGHIAADPVPQVQRRAQNALQMALMSRVEETGMAILFAP